MTLLSAEEDFRTRTLAAVSGALSRLAYVAQLRSGIRYDHWGMIRTHGDAAAQSAIASSHTQLFADVLATPLEALAVDAGDDPALALQTLRERLDDAVPAECAGANAAHLNFVLESLWLVHQQSRASSRRAA